MAKAEQSSTKSQWVLARVRTVVRDVSVAVCVGEDIQTHKVKATMKIVADMETERKQRQEIVEAKSEDLMYDHLKMNVLESLEGGPVDESGKPYSLEEMLHIGPIREAVIKEYDAVMLGLRRKNS